MSTPVPPPPLGVIPLMIQPNPLQVGYDVQRAGMVDGSQMVVLRLDDQQGIKFSFFTPDDAEKLGQDLITRAKQARGGLVVVGNGG